MCTTVPHLQIYRVNELTHKYVCSIDDNLCRYLLSDPRLPAEARMASIAVMLVESMVTSSLVVVLVTSWTHAAAALVGHQLEEDRSPHTQTPAQVSTSRGRTTTQPEPEPGDRRVRIMVTLGNGTLTPTPTHCTQQQFATQTYIIEHFPSDGPPGECFFQGLCFFLRIKNTN